MTMYCSMTGIEIHDSGDGIFEDGEWISWEYINSQIEDAERKERGQTSALFDDLVDIARAYKEKTGRYLAIFGELGELYAEEVFGIRRHKPSAQGSDGKIGNDFVEVKTITPEKKKKKVHVKRAGNFGKLIVVRFDEDYNVQARIVDRSKLQKGKGKKASLSWSSIEKETEPNQTAHPTTL